ncbi:hypothetical protein CO123_02315 [bacterium (Candidatus Howlettbacteria) CG_4_9_14_3_um_filter_37_10]|nr:MAG: hypothetical protein COX25_02835 [bacterium (Candidatus Howlettbacteria) CG23_combo_of_CG06-09_8_20_14_all_37_9]PJB06376.1 MAG: hypothetical protein CO123_02315 [bacterium (Candidatus Howlettbacteria) CG_4_9_14_3_um_filter_37_10]
MNNYCFWDDIEVIKFFGEDTPSEEVVEFLKNLKTVNNTKILDLGFGGGRHTEIIAKMGFDTYGCDPCNGMINYTKNRLKEKGLKAKIIKARMQNLPYEESFFDAVIANGVFHQAISLNDFIKSIKETTRVLKNNSFLYVNVFFLNEHIYNTYYSKEKEVYTFFTEKGLMTTFLPKTKFLEIMRNNNLELEKIVSIKTTKISTGYRPTLKAIFKKT